MSMRLGDKEPSPNWEYRGLRTVGPYVNDGGWRRMDFDEALTVCIDRDYTEMIEFCRERTSILVKLFKGEQPEIDLTSPVSAALRGE